MPGYVSLFQRMTSEHLQGDLDPEEELDAILGAIEETSKKPRVKRHVQTVWQFFYVFIKNWIEWKNTKEK